MVIITHRQHVLSLRVLSRYKEYLAYAVASLLALTTATIFLVYTCIVHARDFMVL